MYVRGKIFGRLKTLICSAAHNDFAVWFFFQGYPKHVKTIASLKVSPTRMRCSDAMCLRLFPAMSPRQKNNVSFMCRMPTHTQPSTESNFYLMGTAKRLPSATPSALLRGNVLEWKLSVHRSMMPSLPSRKPFFLSLTHVAAPNQYHGS
jgi:hypothetical protein